MFPEGVLILDSFVDAEGDDQDFCESPPPFPFLNPPTELDDTLESLLALLGELGVGPSELVGVPLVPSSER